MGKWLALPRVPEPEVMDTAGEAEAYASAAAAAYLDRMDDTFVEYFFRLAPPRGRVLDVGTGPGQIPSKIVRRNPGLCLVGVDLSDSMLARARQDAKAAGSEGLLQFQKADAQKLPFGDGAFDMAISNSLLHHLRDPVAALREMKRVLKSGGPLLVRDLRRPSRWWYPWQVRIFGRHYDGLMRKLYEDSVRAAYTCPEVQSFLRQAGLDGASVRCCGFVYLVIEYSSR